MPATELLKRVMDAAVAGGSLEGLHAEPAVLLECLDGLRAMVVRDLDGALRGIDAIAGLARADGSDRVMARAASARAHALNYATRFGEAVESAAESIGFAERAGDAVEAARARMTLVHAHAKQGRLGDALDAALRAEAAFSEAGEIGLAVQALSNAAIVTRMTGDGDAAIEMFERALGMREHDAPTRAQIESGRAEALLDVGRFADAEDGFVRSAEAFESAGITRAAAIVRGNLADLYGRQGRLAEAIGQFESARRYFEEDRATGELGRILTEQADVYAMTGLYDDAIVGYRRANTLLERAGLVQERARSLIGLGRLLGPRDPAAAAEALDTAASLSESAGNVAWRALARLHKARLLLDAGRHDEALETIDRAGAALQGRRGDALLCEVLRADALIAADRHAEAEAVLTAALPQAEGLGLAVQHAELLWRRAVARRALGNAGGALTDARDAIDLIERLRGTLQGSRFRAGLVGGNRAVYEQAVGLTLDMGATVEAFEITERARGRTLLDLLGGGAELDAAAAAEDEGTRALLGELARARAELNAVYATLDPAAGGDAHSAWLGRVQQAEDLVTATETRLHASRRVRELLGVPEPFGRIASEIGAGQALVSYWFEAGVLRCFVVRGGGVSAVRLDADAETIEDAVQDVLFQVRRGLMRGPNRGVNGGTSDRRQAACIGALGRLHDAVWEPLEEHLQGAEQVAIVPAGALHAVPFGALHDGERHLIERTEPVLLPTASVLPLLRGASGHAPEKVCVLAVPDEIAPEIEAEAWALRDVVPEADIVVGAEATSDLARTMASTAGVLHLACHGAFPPNNPLAAGLRLADRWITVRDVLAWRLPGSVVVLSGCDTGRNTIGAGEELFGFGRGFLAAGARGLVMSLWPAHDRTTRGLMTEMYRARGGDGGAGGMRRALVSSQRSQICAGTHPAFWSNFGYLGV